MPFDIKKMKATGSPAPIVQGVTASSGNGGTQISFSDTGALAYVSGEIGVPEYPVMMMDRNGVVSTLWGEPGAYANPKLSPDGRRLSMTVLRDGNWDVWVYDLERKVSTRLTFHDGYDGDQVWSPDGSEIFYRSDDGLMSATVTTESGSLRAGRPLSLTSGGLSNNQVGIAVAGSVFPDYEITRDGQSFIILQGGEGQSRQNHIILVTRWFDMLRETFPGS
jgi:Tol biopolymer transport system component